MNLCRITTLAENAVYQKGLSAEHGFSVFIEYGGKKILFDTGQTSAFISNAAALNIDPAEVDICVLSHGHYDHTGGLRSFLKINSRADIWIHKNAFDKRYNSANQDIGMPVSPEAAADRFHSVDEITQIAGDIYILPAAPVSFPDDTHFSGFFIEKNGCRVQDEFIDEQSLVLSHNGRLIIISGCSHRGISNIIKYAADHFKQPVELVLGGFHLKNDSVDTAMKLVQTLNSFGIKNFGISHCTGIEKYVILKNNLDAEVFYNYTGNIISL